MALLGTRYRRQDWGGLQGGSGDASRIRDDFTVLPPDPAVDRSIRCELRAGDEAPWSNVGSSSRVDVAQVQAATYSDSSRRNRWISMWLMYEQIAAYSSLDFHFAHEVHTTGGALSAAWGENVTTNQRQLRRTPSGYNHVWPTAARSAIDFGRFHWFAYGFGWATDASGFAELQIDGALVYRETGIITSADGAAWYPKLGWYRYHSVQGTDVCYIARWEVHDSRPSYPIAPPPSGPIDVAVKQTTTVQTTIPAGGLSVDFANDPDRVTAHRRAASPDGWRRRGGIVVPCDLPERGKLARV